MGTMSVSKLGALSLVLGPLLAIVFFLLEPGALLVDRADPSDAIATITALASNAALAHLVAFVVPLGLVITLYGIYVLQIGVRDQGSGDALSRLGLLFIVIATLGWILSNALTHVMANSALQPAQALQAMVPVYEVESGIGLMSSLAAAVGIIFFSLGLASTGDVNRIVALAVAAVSVLAVVSLVIGIGNADQARLTTTIARICYIPWVIWLISLGASRLKSA